MTRISLGSLVPSTLGFERFFDEVERMLDTDIKTSSPTFPPHNIIKIDDTHYVVELAVAGFSRDDIEVTVDNGTLTIRGEKKDKDTDVTYLHRGIGTRAFTKTLKIADTVEVRGAEHKDGILRIGLENIIPEHQKPRKIEIGSELKNFKPQLLTEKKAA